ncbi:MAG TPA: electron transfer flavoprotein subunit alpha/FixB family protein [Eoetvoesiella sp.]
MQANHSHRIVALVFSTEPGSPTDYAPLEVARDLANRCDGTAHALIIGPQTDAAIERAQAAKLDSISAMTLPLAESALQTHQTADLFAHAINSTEVPKPAQDTIFLIAAGSEYEDMAGLLAARLKAIPLGKAKRFIVGETGRICVERAAFGGRLNLVLECREGPYIATVRKIDYELDDSADNKQPVHVRQLDSITPPTAYSTTFTERPEQHASLDGAKLVVSGGRGIGGEAGFTALYELADSLGGAVGSSLPAVDAGWAPVARQVGQSGKYVTPELYLAIGISGTPQHLAGIDPHTKIIAVNKDPEAGIFQAAHIGVVADWQEFLPALQSALKVNT